MGGGGGGAGASGVRVVVVVSLRVDEYHTAGRVAASQPVHHTGKQEPTVHLRRGKGRAGKRDEEMREMTRGTKCSRDQEERERDRGGERKS